MLNPDGRLWIDGLGLSDTGKRLSAQDGERIVRVVAHDVGAEVHPQSPRISAELPVLGIAVSATVVNDRTNLHFLRIAEHLNFSNTELAGWLRRMTSHYIQAWGDRMIGETAALKKLWEAAYRDAQVQAFADAYLVIAVCFAISAMMVPLMRGVTPK